MENVLAHRQPHAGLLLVAQQWQVPVEQIVRGGARGSIWAVPAREVARRLGVSEVRFKSPLKARPVDDSTPSLVRDPNKCILCGDCVRMCHDVQSVGAKSYLSVAQELLRRVDAGSAQGVHP